MEKMYLVNYSGGSYDNSYTYNIFVTTKQSTAKKYVAKFNRILKKWQKYYSQFEQNDMGFTWIKEEHIEQHFDRWNSLRDINGCYYDEIEVR